jgi:hypothetical protein
MAQVPKIQMRLVPSHQAVFDACVTSGPLYDIIKEANRRGKERGLSEISFGEVGRILSSLRLLGLVAQTENGTWFAPVTPEERKKADKLNAEWKHVQPGEGIGAYLKRTIPEELQIQPEDRLFKEAGQS